VRPRGNLSLTAGLLLFALLLVLRVLLPAYSQLVFLIVFYVVLGIAFNIFTGFSGYVCFGYSAFIALGSYGMALAFKELAASTVNMFVVIAAGLGMAALLATVLAIGIGGVSLRLREVYFAIATIGLNRAVRFFIEGANVWGGAEGLIIAGDIIVNYGDKALSFVSIDFADYTLIALGVITFVLSYKISRSRLGYALLSIKEDEDVAEAMGVNTTKYKLVAFTISAVLAGFLGAVKVLKDQAVYPPDAFSLTLTIEAILITLIGGSGTVIGPVVGGLVYSVMKYFLTAYFPGLQLLILAPLLIIIVVVFPYGFIGWLRLRYRSLREVLI
jgi:branched-chain amino acid transport system permease protein